MQLAWHKLIESLPVSTASRYVQRPSPYALHKEVQKRKIKKSIEKKIFFPLLCSSSCTTEWKVKSQPLIESHTAIWRSISDGRNRERKLLHRSQPTVANSNDSSKILVSGWWWWWWLLLVLSFNSKLQSFVVLLILDDCSSSECAWLLLDCIIIVLRILMLPSLGLYHI